MSDPAAAAAARTLRSQRYFNRLSLAFYDLVLYGVISRYAWGCSIERLDAHYRRHASANHLEVGVGTGFLLDRVRFPTPQPRLALMDLSAACLAKTARRIARYQPASLRQNLLEPLQHTPAPFDSIAVNYVLHCVPGACDVKTAALAQLKPLLAPGGVLFGTTVLGRGVRKNALARPFMWLMNALGVFNNREDCPAALRSGLEAHFRVLEFEVVGVTAVFAVTSE